MDRKLIVFALICGLFLAGCSSRAGDVENRGTINPEPTQVEPPQEYTNRTNPFDGDAAAPEDGKVVYLTNCASCHGESAKGDGPAAISLDPKPQNLADTVGNISDGYLFWRISEGGMMAPFHSVMPAWKTILSEDQIWQVITYLRSLGG